MSALLMQYPLGSVAGEHLKCDKSELRSTVNVNYTLNFEGSVGEKIIKYLLTFNSITFEI